MNDVHVKEPPKAKPMDPAMEKRVNDLLVGAVDMHCHSGPSVMPRAIDHIQAVEEAASVGMRALLFKDHYYSATPITELLNERYKHLGVTMLSGVPLNNTSGGLNPYTIDHGLKLGAKIVWMPTFSAANHLKHNYRGHLLQTKEPMLPPTGLEVVDAKGVLKDEVKFILDQIAEKDVVMSAGHLHISEIFTLFEEAKKRGVNRRIVQHPTYTIDATMADIRDLVAGGSYIEHSMCMFIDESRFKKWGGKELKDVIAAGTVDKTILGSDLGQIKNPTPVTGFKSVIRLCLESGYSEADIRKLVGGNAAKLMGLA